MQTFSILSSISGDMSLCVEMETYILKLEGEGVYLVMDHCGACRDRKCGSAVVLIRGWAVMILQYWKDFLDMRHCLAKKT